MSACNEANGWMTLYMEVVMSRVGSRVAQKSHGQTPSVDDGRGPTELDNFELFSTS